MENPHINNQYDELHDNFRQTNEEDNLKTTVSIKTWIHKIIQDAAKSISKSEGSIVIKRRSKLSLPGK